MPLVRNRLDWGRDIDVRDGRNESKYDGSTKEASFETLDLWPCQLPFDLKASAGDEYSKFNRRSGIYAAADHSNNECVHITCSTTDVYGMPTSKYEKSVG